MEININPEDIDSLVKQKILESTIGKTFAETITKLLSPNSWNNPLEDELKRVLGTYVREVLEQEKGEELRQLIRDHVAQRITTDVLARVVETAVDKMIEAFKSQY